MGKLSNAWRQPEECNRFTRIDGPTTRFDLERYAAELNEGPMRGWCVNRMANGSLFLDRNDAPRTAWKPSNDEMDALKHNMARIGN